MPTRRAYLGTVGTVAAASGCLGVADEVASSPQYSADDKEEMLPPADVFPTGWVRDDSLNERWDAGYRNSETSAAVLINITIHDTIGGAKEDLADSRQRFRDPQDIDIGDDGFWGEQNGGAYCIFRHSNAEGQAFGLMQSGLDTEPAVGWAQEGAERLYKHWQTL